MSELGENEMRHTSKSSPADKRLASRRHHLLKACKTVKLDKEINKQRNLEINLARGRLRLCGLEKVASTFMKELVYTEHSVQNRHHFPEGDPKKFTSFVIVREPYARLLSVYLDKLRTRAVWWRYIGKYIIERFRYRSTEFSRGCGSDVTFPEFIRFWIHSLETDQRRDGHFDPMHRQCQFCLFRYDYYVHLETLFSDMKFLYKTINSTLVREMTNEEDTLKDKADSMIEQRKSNEWQPCETNCSMLDRAWWSFHARGLVAEDVPNPVTGDWCSNITSVEFVQIAMQAHHGSKGRFDKKKQRRDKMVELYLQIPLLDRLKVRELLALDFKLHGYESTPKDLFPELHRG